jgi:hypothetical protein
MQGVVGLIGLELFLDPARTLEQVFVLVAGQVIELQEMFDLHNCHRGRIISARENP